VVFDEMNVRHMKLFGCWLVVAAVVINVSGRAFFAVTEQPAHDTANAAMALVYGGMIYVIARVMEIGREADLERKAFV
jgi:predicted signal transduction protein with EAL and GGDEF domain